MRPIHLVRLDKTRPAVVLTRDVAIAAMRRVTVAPVTSTIRGLSTEVLLGADNGLDQPSVVSCDNLNTVSLDDVGRRVGMLYDWQEADLVRALVAAFDLGIERLI